MWFVIKAWLFAFTHPNYWIMLNTYSKPWDDELNRLLEAGTRFSDFTKYDANFGPYNLWIVNIPYSAFALRTSFRPRRITVHRMVKRLQESMF